MNDLTISLACGDYARTRLLREGSIRLGELPLVYVNLPPAELFWRMLKYEEFDASELSLSAYIMGISRGDRRFVGIPVFPSRVFRHAFIFVNRNSGIREPKDLRGKRVGVPEYHMTAALFIRGFLSDDYGLEPEEMEWFQGGLETPGRMERVSLDLPSDVSLTHVADRTLDEMLLSGDLDAVFSATVPPSVRAGGTKIVRLFDDAKRLEIEYYARTGVFPIMHTVVIRRAVIESFPWIAMELRKAFEAAKEDYFRRISKTHNDPGCGLPFAHYELEETLAIFGDDFWPYGVEANRQTLEAAVRYSWQQGLSARPVAVDELFDPRADAMSVE